MVQFGDVGVGVFALAGDEALEHRRDLPMNDVMGAVRPPRLEATSHLVLTASAGFQLLESLVDAVLDQQVIRQLEVKVVVVPGTAPVAAIDARAFVKVQGAGDDLTIRIGGKRTQHALSLVTTPPSGVAGKGPAGLPGGCISPLPAASTVAS